MPAADDLFRPTEDETSAEDSTRTRPKRVAVRAVPDAPEEPAPRRSSGRIRHDEKMTVYVTSEELLEIEQARLQLRGAHGLAVDRGRLVREAISLVITDLDENGVKSALVRRLTEE
jgi:hypothetical protein